MNGRLCLTIHRFLPAVKAGIVRGKVKPAKERIVTEIRSRLANGRVPISYTGFLMLCKYQLTSTGSRRFRSIRFCGFSGDLFFGL